MEDLIVDIAEGNIIEYQNIFFYVVLYLCSLWLLFAIWVYFDAKKRFEGSLLPFLLALVVFILNFPALMFYLIIRPEDEEDYTIIDGLSGHHHSRGGVDVPLVNFVGKEGEIELSLYLKVNKVKPSHDEDININVDFAKSQKFKEVEIKSKKVELEPVKKAEEKLGNVKSNVESKLSKALIQAKGKLGSALAKVRAYTSSLEEEHEQDKNESENQEDKNK